MAESPIDVDALKKLPKEVWFGIAAVGIGIVWFTKTRNGGDFITDGGSDTEDNQSVPLNPGVGVGGWTQTNPTETQPQVIDDNNEWAQKAISHLTSSGYNGALADEAIRRYLSSVTLTPAQGVMVGIAIRDIGPPPEVLAAGPVVPAVPGVTNPSTAGTNKPSSTSTPKAPTNVKVAGLGKHSVEFTWSPVPNAVSYRVYHAKNMMKSSTGTSAHIGDLKPGIRYTFYIRAVNANGIMSGNSNPITFTTRK